MTFCFRRAQVGFPDKRNTGVIPCLYNAFWLFKFIILCIPGEHLREEREKSEDQERPLMIHDKFVCASLTRPNFSI